MHWKVNRYDGRVRIGQLAKTAGVTSKTIRFYEETGVLPEPPRRASGYREYDAGAVERLAFIKAAQGAGLTLAEIAQIIAVRDSAGPPCEHVTALLARRAGDLEHRIAELTALRDQVVRLHARATRLDPAMCSAAGVCDAIPVGSE